MGSGRSSVVDAALLLVLFLAFAAPLRAQTQAVPPAAAATAGKYNGPGSCAASNCHGGVQPKDVTRIAQNEYSIWAAQDKHARAYSVLSNSVSQRMGKILGIEQPNKAEKCLVCHALQVPPELRATTFQLDDGVSCENCHGPAVGWLGPHTTKDWKHEQSIKLGMYDTRDLVNRSEKCLTCHLGTPDKQVDHEMIAAGHPDLTFELDSFSAVMPRHWKLDRVKNPWNDVQELAVGQAVQLRDSLQRLSRRASSPKWPEFAELDCFSCHHSLTKPQDSWRQATGYAGRRPGVPPWNAARFVVLRHFADAVDPQAGQRVQSELDNVSSLVNKWASPQEIAASANNAAATLDQLVQQLRAQRYGENFTARVMASIAADSQIALQGERSAEQAAMALDTLAVAYAKNAKLTNEQELRAAINKLFQQLDNPSAYNAPQFAAQMQRVRVLVPRSQAASRGQ